MTSSHRLPQSSIVHPYISNHKPPVPERPFSNPNLLAPEAAFHAHSSLKRHAQSIQRYPESENNVAATNGLHLRGGGKRASTKTKHRNGTRRPKRPWQKLLWVKQKDCKLVRSKLSLKFLMREQTLTITPTLLPFCLISSETLVYDPTNSGHW